MKKNEEIQEETSIRILMVYKFATFGGVERILLNRACMFKKHNMNYKLLVYFIEDLRWKTSF